MESGNLQGSSAPVVHSTVSSSTSSGLVQLLTSSPAKALSSPILLSQINDSKSTIHHMGLTASSSCEDGTGKIALPQATVTTPVTYSGLGVQNVNQFSLIDLRAKRRRLVLEEKAPESEEVAELRISISSHHHKCISEKREYYSEHLSELYFLQSGFNAMDYLTWRKRANAHLASYLKFNCLDSDEEDTITNFVSTTASISSGVPTVTTVGATMTTTCTTLSSAPVYPVSSHSEVKIPSNGGTPVAVSTCLPPAVSQLTQQGIGISKPKGGRHGMVFGNHQPLLTNVSNSLSLFPGGTPLVLDTSSQPIVNKPLSLPSTSSRPVELNVATTLTTSSVKLKSPTSVVTPITSMSLTSPTKLNRAVTVPNQGSTSTSSSSTLPASPTRLQTRLHSISAVYDSTIGSQEEIAERAKQEAYVMQRISELRKEGVWSEKRLPKVQEPQRNKAHWDYLLEEMVWLATDFAQERKWKKTAGKKCAKMCQKYHMENKLKEERAEKEVELKLKRIASAIAKEIKQFWTNVEKFVEYKQQSRLDLKRKKVLDLQLNFIVDQTEKYSTWVAEGMNKSVTESTQNSLVSSAQLSRASSPLEQQSDTASDGDFEPSEETSDDEETIAKAEHDENQDDDDRKAEIDLLEKESLVPLDKLLEGLPPDFLKDLEAQGTTSGTKNEGEKIDSDFEMKSGDESSDDESTMEAEEAAEGAVDYSAELNQLKDEGDMSIEELLKMYKGADDKIDSDDSSDDERKSSLETSDEESECMTDEDSGLDIGLESLVDLDETGEDNKNSVDLPTKEITFIAAAAESFKPKGYTYSTVKVAVKVPHLLRHQLREYQHIGLDWLVTMYERKLNGILADEMGLGKTIQTIALLAYLACEKGNWGPHLIVVPTSVMLNWEMEFKKWCPGFKILTYYGNPKERKLKRQGWTKPNTFHVCITSYKLVIQDHQSFRRKKWKYFILDEAQNIKNFKSQRWQLLLNFKSHRRLLLTGTPLQNSLMELWSLMHFLMPNVFLSHQDFKEWFANPVSGMIEGSHEYNKELINRLHKVLRPFLLRRLKSEVEKQLPRKFEHVVMCRLSKRQRYLYEDFMSQTKTKETLASGSFMSVINVLMQLRKVCNHPNLFESRPIVSPFQMEGIVYNSASLASRMLEPDSFKVVNLASLNMLLVNLELNLTAFAAHRIKRFQTPRRLIEEIDDAAEPPPKCPAGKIKLHVRTTSSGMLTPPSTPRSAATCTPPPVTPLAKVFPTKSNGPSSIASARIIGVDQTPRLPLPQATPAVSVVTTTTAPVSTSTTTTVTTPTTTSASNRSVSTSYTLQLVQPSPSSQSGSSFSVAQVTSSSTPITVHIHQTQQGPRLSVPTSQLAQLSSGYAQLVQTATGQHILLTSSSSSSSTVPQTNSTVQSVGLNPRTITSPRVTVTFPSGTSSSPLSLQSKSSSSVLTVTSGLNPVKPVLRVTPMKSIQTLSPSSTSATLSSAIHSSITTPSRLIVEKPATRQQTRVSDEVVSNTSSAVYSQFRLEELVRKRQLHRKERLERLARLNTRRCDATPVYGSDLIEAVTVINSNERLRSSWKGSIGSVPDRRNNSRRWDRVTALEDFLTTPETCLERLNSILTRFSFAVPSVMAPEIGFHVSHPLPYRLHQEMMFYAKLRSELSPRATFLHSLTNSMSTQFPDARLIQYDCGKLQTLDRLLRRLKTEGRRALIFTQMTRMLDILEQFLNFHGHIYLRLDGATKVDQRQALMERFNADRRIFCFILSTRSGGIGVNLTGADTVIFYDSDWNPTMDAQAQDRCHRIGQTRDVHIYRLISERTVEENILKKANQKRLLGEVAIEGGNFTTAFFKKHTLQELFEVDDGIKESSKLQEPLMVKPDASGRETTVGFTDISNVQLEHALANAEEDLDIQAAKSAKKEADLELVEFDESIPYDGDGSRDEETCKMEEELGAMMAELTPIQRYAMNFLESIQEPFSLEQLKQAEEEIEAQKKDWELGRLQALREEEERRAQADDNDLLCTYLGEDASNQIFISANTGEQMPLWAPPTPPQDDSDVYIDYSTCFLYEPTIMPESQLPPVYVRKEHKRIRVDSSTALSKKQKSKKDENIVNIPKSLFDRPSPAVLKMRKYSKTQRFRTVGNPVMTTYKAPVVVHKANVETQQDVPEWLIHEDWALLQSVQTLLELPLNLIVLSPGHIPNWDLVAEVVNATSRIYRSPKQCRVRYETVIIPREEGKILYDINPNKPKKSKGIYRTKNNRPMRSSQLFLQDNNNSFTQLHHQRFDTIKAVANKRMPTLRQMIVNPGARNPKHTAVLEAGGISFEQPLTPVQIATMRADRIARDKSKGPPQTPEQPGVTPQQMPPGAASPATTPTVGTVSGLQLATRPQMNVVPGQQQVLTVAGNQQSLASPSQAVVGQITAQQLQSVIGRIAVTTSGLTCATVTASVRAQRTPQTALIMQDVLGGSQLRGVVPQNLVANASNAQTLQQVIVSTSQRVTPTAVVTNITPGALSAQVVSSPGKSPTAAQLQLYTRNPTLYKQQRLQAGQQHQVTTISVQQQPHQQQNKVPVSVTSLLSPNVATVQLTPSQQQQLRNQTMARTMTEVEVNQLLKRQQLQQLQQQKANATAAQVQVSSTGQQSVQQQILSTAQLQQLQQQQQQAVAAAAMATGQSSFATLVKTVSTPGALGTATSTPTVTIPVGMNINLPQVKAGVTGSKNVIVAHQQQQVEQMKLQQQQQQQQIIQQRKLIQQQKLSLGKSSIGTVQLVPQQGLKASPTTLTAQQLHNVMKSAQAQSSVTTTANLMAGAQTLPHTFLTKSGQVTIASPTTVTTALQARVVPLGQNVTAVVPSALSQGTGSPRQTIQVFTTTNHAQLRIPATSGPTFTIDATRAQTVNVVPPTLTVTLPAQVKDLSNQEDASGQ